jgi:CRISPR-associated protein Cas1
MIIYLKEQGAKVTRQGDLLVISKDDQTVSKLHLFKIDAVVIIGRVHISHDVLTAFLLKGIDTAFFSMKGKLYGRLIGTNSKNIILRMKQYQNVQNEFFRVEFSKQIIRAKIRNMIRVLKEFHKNHPDQRLWDTSNMLNKWFDKIHPKNKTNTILGIESSASALYFSCFSIMIRSTLTFKGRIKHPPGDEVNALLSFTYVLLGNEISNRLYAHGFDPYIGFYHGIQYGRASLSMDMIEEFRPIVDRFVIRLVNLRVFGPENFQEKDGGVYLTGESLKEYLTHYEKWLNKKDSMNRTLRDVIDIQVLHLSECLKKELPYKPFF